MTSVHKAQKGLVPCHLSEFLLSFSSLISQTSLSVLGALLLEALVLPLPFVCLDCSSQPVCVWLCAYRCHLFSCLSLKRFSTRLLLFICVCVCLSVPHFSSAHTEKPQTGHQTSQNWSSDSRELPCGGSELNLGSLKEQPTLVPTQPFLQLSLVFPESLSKASLFSRCVSLFPSPVFLLNTLLLCGTQYTLYTGLSVPFPFHQNACSASDLFVLFRYVAILFLKTSR